MTTQLLSIIIVTRNRRAELHRCLRSLERLSYLNVEIVVIDNASTDGLADMVADEFPQVRLFHAARNYGCGVGRNVGARMARGDLLWFIDDDAEVLWPDAAERLIGKLQAEPDIGAIGGEALIDERGQVVGVKQLDLMANGMTTGRFTLDIADDTWLDAELLAGCNVLVRREDFKALGGFDPTYRHGWEDTDFSFRLRASGRRLLIAGFAPVLHHFSGLERQASLRVPAQSRAYFAAKNMPGLKLALMPLLDLVYLLNPLRWGRILDKARRIDYGAKGRILRPSVQTSEISIGQFTGALRVALNYAATVGGSYVFGWRMIQRGLAARRAGAPDGWEAAAPLLVEQHAYDLTSVAAAE